MKKIIACTIFFMTLYAVLFAGDAAVFCDIGFSEDGKTYIFGQYGKTDVDYQAWAEIYTVDVAKNDFVKGEIFKTSPSSDTERLSGKEAFEQLRNKAEWKLSKYKCNATDGDKVLYLRTSDSDGKGKSIRFRDFESYTENDSVTYSITLRPTYTGKGKDCKSSFVIDVSKIGANNVVVKHYIVGTPSVKRQGVTDYSIEKIMTDKSGKNLVFVVQKVVEDETGSSIRYMVETVKI